MKYKKSCNILKLWEKQNHLKINSSYVILLFKKSIESLKILLTLKHNQLNLVIQELINLTLNWMPSKKLKKNVIQMTQKLKNGLVLKMISKKLLLILIGSRKENSTNDKFQMLLNMDLDYGSDIFITYLKNLMDQPMNGTMSLESLNPIPYLITLPQEIKPLLFSQEEELIDSELMMLHLKKLL